MDISAFLLFWAAIFTSNILLTNFLGMCSYLSVSREVESSLGLGVAVTFVLVFTTALNWLAYRFVLVPFHIEYLQYIVFIIIIAAFVQLLELLIELINLPLGSLGSFLILDVTAIKNVQGTIRHGQDRAGELGGDLIADEGAFTHVAKKSDVVLGGEVVILIDDVFVIKQFGHQLHFRRLTAPKTDGQNTDVDQAELQGAMPVRHDLRAIRRQQGVIIWQGGGGVTSEGVLLQWFCQVEVGFALLNQLDHLTQTFRVRYGFVVKIVQLSSDFFAFQEPVLGLLGILAGVFINQGII